MLFIILLFQMQLKFSAPPKPGIYTYNIILRSDSYFDFDQVHNIKVCLWLLFVEYFLSHFLSCFPLISLYSIYFSLIV
jgi:hypothetical protein